MPKLVPHVSEVAAPKQSGAVYQTPEFRAQAAGGGLLSIAEPVQQLGNALVQRYKENEAAELGAEFSKFQADMTIKQEEAFRTADPNDKEVGKRFYEETFLPGLDAIGQKAQSRSGQMIYDAARANMEATFKVNTAAKQANLAGTAAVNNYLTTKNLNSSAVRANPSALENSQFLAELAVPMNIEPEKRLALLRDAQKENAAAAINGMIDQNNFDAAEQLLKSGELDKWLDASDKTTLQGNIETGRRAAAADALVVENARLKKIDAENEAEANAIMATVVQPDGTLFVPPGYNQQIVGYSQRERANVGTTQALTNFGRAVTEDQLKDVITVSDPSTYEGFRQRIGLDPSDRRAIKKPEVLQARADRRLSDKDFSLFMRAVDDNSSDPAKVEQRRQFNRIMEGYKPSIGGLNIYGNFIKADTAQQFLYFQQDAQAIFDDMTAKGKTEEDITTAIGNMVPNYQLNKATSMNAVRNNTRTNPSVSVRPAAPDANKMLPGETIEAWRARTKR